MTRRYIIRLQVEKTAGRRLDATAHRKQVVARVEKALRSLGWTVAAARVASRLVVEEEAPAFNDAEKMGQLTPAEAAVLQTPPPVARDRLARIDRKLPQGEREWMAGVLEAEGMVRWTIRQAGRVGFCYWHERRINIGSAWLTRSTGLEYQLVERWLCVRRCYPRQVSGLRWMFLHEVAHGVTHKRDLADGNRSKTHGTRFRRALLGIARRHAPEAFADVTRAAAAGPQET